MAFNCTHRFNPDAVVRCHEVWTQQKENHLSSVKLIVDLLAPIHPCYDFPIVPFSNYLCAFQICQVFDKFSPKQIVCVCVGDKYTHRRVSVILFTFRCEEPTVLIFSEFDEQISVVATVPATLYQFSLKQLALTL